MGDRGRVGDAEHRELWSRAHGGLRASPLVAWWLRGVRTAASPLARAGVSPSAVTLAALALSLVAVVPAAAGGRWALAVPLLLAASAVADALDGAVAVMTGTCTHRGAVLDAVVDRVADAVGPAALWLLGAPAPLAVAAVGAGWLAEYARARAQAEGVRGPGVVTVAERPTRVAVAAMFALGAGCYPGSAAPWATTGAAVWLVTASVGLVQLLVALRARLRDLDA